MHHARSCRIRRRIRSAATLISMLMFSALTVRGEESFTATHYARLSGDEEVPSVVTEAAGIVLMRLDPTAMTLEYRAIVTGLSGAITAAHFHLGPRGEGGPPIETVPFPSGALSVSGVWSISNVAHLTALLNGEIYFNVHSQQHGGGEIRGQVTLIPNGLAPSLDPEAEAPPVTGSDGTGKATLWIDPTRKTVGYLVEWDSLTSSVTAAHFHIGAIGRNGSPVHTITVADGASSAVGMWENLTVEQLTSLLTGEVYVNIHTQNHPEGEIRGQVFPTNAYTAFVSPLNETPPVTSGSTAEGAGYLVTIVTPFGFVMAGDFIVEGTTGPIRMAHVHGGIAGENGDVMRAMAPQEAVSIWHVEETVLMPIDSLLLFNAESMYVNFHTDQFGSGEARGQLIPAATNLVTATSDVPSDGGAVAPLEIEARYDGRSETARFRITGHQNGLLTLYDMLGRVVAIKEITEGETTVGTGGLPSGVYGALFTLDGAPTAARRLMIYR